MATTDKLYLKLKHSDILFKDVPQPRASYIMYNGKFMDMENSKHVLGIFGRSPNHRDLFLFCLQKKFITGSDADFLLKTADNAIRVNDGLMNVYKENPSVSLPLKNLNRFQYIALEKWLEYVMNFSTCVEIGFLSKKNLMTYDFLSPTNDKGKTPSDIIDDIIVFYNGIAGMDVESMLK